MNRFNFWRSHLINVYEKIMGPGKQVQIIEVLIIKVRLYNESSLTKSYRRSHKWTALLTATFTKPHFNSHTNSVFFNPHKQLQIFLGFTSSIFALMSLNTRNEISFHYWMKTCENAVKNRWNRWQENTLWKNLWILHSLNFDKISKFRTL